MSRTDFFNTRYSFVRLLRGILYHQEMHLHRTPEDQFSRCCREMLVSRDIASFMLCRREVSR
jgi:hypothetical protein